MESIEEVYKTAFDRLDENDEFVQRIIPIYENDDNLYNRRQSTAYVYLWYKCGAKDVIDLFGNNGSFQRKVLEHLHQELIDESEKGKVQQDAVRQIIYTICHANEDIRDLLFLDDKKDLEALFEDGCKEESDYESYIENHPRTYPEYLLHAKYQIARLSHAPFVELYKVKTDYGDCDWVKNIECETTKSGITYMITKESNLNEEERRLIVSFLENFSRIEVSGYDIDKGDSLIANSVVSEKIWDIVMRSPSLFKTDVDTPKFVYYKDIEAFVDKLQQMVCVRFRLPTESERAKLEFSGKNDEETPFHLWEWCISDEREKASVRCVCEEVKLFHGKDILDLDSCFATCRLMLDDTI